MLFPVGKSGIASKQLGLNHSTSTYAKGLHQRCRPAAAVTICVPQLKEPVSFPNLGSGLLFARTTGLKIMLGEQWNEVQSLAYDHQQPTQSLRASTRIDSSTSTSDTSRSIPGSFKCRLSGQLAVELGGGLGLCSLAACLAGAQVIATDGDADLVRLMKKNLVHNLEVLKATEGVPVPRAAVLPWGDEEALRKLQVRLHDTTDTNTDTNTNTNTTNTPTTTEQLGHSSDSNSNRDSNKGQDTPSALPSVDLVLLSDCIYGSNPGIWQRLIHTLQRLSGPSTLVLQAESRRIEGLLYGEYWQMLGAAGFNITPIEVSEHQIRSLSTLTHLQDGTQDTGQQQHQQDGQAHDSSRVLLHGIEQQVDDSGKGSGLPATPPPPVQAWLITRRIMPGSP